GHHHPYSAGVTVYQAAPYDGTAAHLSQGNALLHEQTCLHGAACVPGYAFNVPDQQSVNLQIFYDRGAGVLKFIETAADGSTYSGSYHIGIGEHFTKAEITSDFGTWLATHDGYTAAPAVQTSYLRWSGAQITSYTGHRGDLVDWWTRHHVALAGAPGGAKAG